MDLKLTSIERTDRYLFSYDGIRNRKHERPDPTYDNSMKTYQLTNEEKANYQNTGVLKMGKALAKKDLTKEAFVARKEQGRTDLSIAREYGIHGPDISKLREQWGLTGMKAADFIKKPEKQIEKQQPKVEVEEVKADSKPNHEPTEENSNTVSETAYMELKSMYDGVVKTSREKIGLLESAENKLKALQIEHEALKREHDTLQTTHKKLIDTELLLREDHEALCEEAEKLRITNQTLNDEYKNVYEINEKVSADNVKLWETNKKLIEEKEQPSTDRYEALYKATVKALAVHLPV